MEGPKIFFVHSGYKEPTEEAKELAAALRDRKIRVLIEANDGYKHVDLGIPDAKLNVEVDGIQHLTDPKQIVKDLSRGYYSMTKHGYATMHIPNEMIRPYLSEIADGLAEAAKIREHKIKVHF